MKKHMNHSNHGINSHDSKKHDITKEADNLCVNCGCDSEAKQYEYKIHNSVSHKGHSDSGIIYTCPMHPEVKSKTPGRCPACGMDLIPKKVSVEKQRVSCSANRTKVVN